ncbi:hypothetical protein CDAR_485291 [Caerostris darwini]|uniref:Uncharacterized protein n=1 Tax=Caerostris darwini TaxID=1538125 RepID=A0AAV4PAT5_9ARAC|nr:hypothetical protein CDAR_485291 [Caerostris darwini]
MPARGPTTISEVLDKEGRLRAMTRRHHNEGELSLPLCIRPSAPPTGPPPPCHPLPPEFHNATATCTESVTSNSHPVTSNSPPQSHSSKIQSPPTLLESMKNPNLQEFKTHLING